MTRKINTRKMIAEIQENVFYSLNPNHLKSDQFEISGLPFAI